MREGGWGGERTLSIQLLLENEGLLLTHEGTMCPHVLHTWVQSSWGTKSFDG